MTNQGNPHDFEGEVRRRFATGPEGSELESCSMRTLQVNIGLTCNQECVHCHVSSFPLRSEQMDWPTMEKVLEVGQEIEAELIDITGGAPELNPHFRRFVAALRSRGLAVQVRTNLTILLTSGNEDLPEFHREHRVHLVASLPCYLEAEVDEQRGDKVFERSIQALHRLNEVGYGREEELQLDLVYNPLGPFLPPDQAALETDYRRELQDRHGIQFSRLITIANMPIGRFREGLVREGRLAAYEEMLAGAFNPDTVDALMCRHQIVVGWDGTLYDCDFNHALGIPLASPAPARIEDFDAALLERRRIATGKHCFGCTAGCGSSCSGALVQGGPEA